MPGARTLAKEMDDPGTAQKFRGFVLSQLVKLHGDRWSVWGGPAEHMIPGASVHPPHGCRTHCRQPVAR